MITVQINGNLKKFDLNNGESLLDGLIREGLYVSALCGGNGRCGKCKVKVLSGSAPISSGDEKFFSDLQLAEGWRLSCLLYPTEDLTVCIALDEEAEFEAISAFAREGARKDRQADVNSVEIAIDIGTTTIALQLVNQGGEILGTVTTLNSQRKYGADVVTRIQASVDGKRKQLQESICKDLQNGITALLEKCGQPLERLTRVAIACNTTMSHLLLGYDCTSLGLYPYTPVNIGTIYGTVKEMIGLTSEAEVVILPGISTYVGADIVAGLSACDFLKGREVCLLVDLGTNGEMALGNRENLLVTSTAAGPAFEGGNLTWGMGSVAGAICSVEIEQQTYVETIRNQAPIGICGTGVVEAIAEMLKVGILDETGLLDEEYFTEGFCLAKTKEGNSIVLTQKDIRELQLAKAAVRAGIETLCLRYGVAKEQVSKVYLAGGFGYRLDVEKAIAIGMLPEEFSGKVEAVGNSSLAGAVKFLIEGHKEETMQEIVRVSEEIGLSMDKDFNDFYMEYMMFE